MRNLLLKSLLASDFCRWLRWEPPMPAASRAARPTPTCCSRRATSTCGSTPGSSCRPRSSRQRQSRAGRNQPLRQLHHSIGGGEVRRHATICAAKAPGRRTSAPTPNTPSPKFPSGKLSEDFHTDEFGAACAVRFDVGGGVISVIGGGFVEELNYDRVTDVSVPINLRGPAGCRRCPGHQRRPRRSMARSMAGAPASPMKSRISGCARN